LKPTDEGVFGKTPSWGNCFS